MIPLLSRLGLSDDHPGGFCGRWVGSGPPLEVRSPIDDSHLATVRQVTADEYDHIVEQACRAFLAWRMTPAPRRGELVRLLGQQLRECQEDLAGLITLENGKILSEARGEVQEMIDICDLACGMSRQLYGLTMHSERPRHRMYEQWHPLGVVGIITAFNFPVAVWSWNAAVAVVCGDPTVWKPSPQTPLTAIAVARLAAQVCEQAGFDPALFSLATGSVEEVGERMIADRRLPLISATGSCRMGRRVAQVVAGRLGRTILELGGNNAVIVTPSANLELATRAILFGAVGTAGQRCTTIRRLIVHRAVREPLLERLIRAYQSVRIGDPRDPQTLCGPLISTDAVAAMQRAIHQLREQGGRVLYGGEPLEGPAWPGGRYVRPCIAQARNDMPIVQEETFAPILYVITYGDHSDTPAAGMGGGHAALQPAGSADPAAQTPRAGLPAARPVAPPAWQNPGLTPTGDLAEALAYHNAVPQGLSSAIFTESLREAEEFLSAFGSDCGIANVNIGTSGAEIGGAFGGEKDTGGGREAGSDAWKAYMRRQTCTINWSDELPLAQGIRFGQ